MNEKEMGYLIVTDYIKANTGEDVSDALQELILNNPHRTIFFPDGEYVLAKPICTPANPVNSVSLHLSNYAILKAADGWDSDEAMVRLGAAEPYNSIYIPGSNYYFMGGIIEGNGVAKGISIDSGRETLIERVSIKHTTVGIHIKHGANNNSSDADILNVNIVGNGKVGSIGVLIEGFDNTLTNMRIAGVQTGVQLTGAGNLMRNLHPLGGVKADVPEYYADGCAFRELGGGNFYDMCYSDNFAVGFEITATGKSLYNDCFCYWYTAAGDCQIGFKTKGKFRSIIKNANVSFNGKSDPKFNAYIKVGEPGGGGMITFPVTRDEAMEDKTYREYMHGSVIN